VDRARFDSKTPVVRYRTDARSYILPSFQFESPDATVAFIGGSTTQCTAVQESLRFPALVSTLLKEGGLEVNTLNAGYSGNTLHDAILVLLNHVVEDHPDIVVVMHAANDGGVIRRDGGYVSRMGKAVGVRDLAAWGLQYASSRIALAGLLRRSFHEEARGRAAGDYIWRNDPSESSLNFDAFRQRVRLFIHAARDLGIRPVVMTQPLSGSTNDMTPGWANLGTQSKMNAILREVCQEESADLIDLARHVEATVPDWERPNVIFYDSMHVNDTGSRVYAEHITERLRPMVEAVKAARRATD
jgi:lysophospholipase L1-like esterase